MRHGVLLGAALVALGTIPAAAHVVLTRAEVPAEAEVDLAMRAPIERENTTNRKIYALVPGPFEVLGCEVPSVAWECTLDTTTRAGDTFITWETPVAGSPQDLRFEFTVRTPRSDDAGEYKFPVVQTYADGHTARWIQDGEPSPAPRLKVVPKGQPVSTAEPTPPPDATRSPAPAPSASRSAARTTAPSAPTGATASASAASAAVPAASASRSAAASASPAATATGDAFYSDALEDLDDDSSSRPVGPVVAAVAALLGAAGAVAATVVRRRA